MTSDCITSVVITPKQLDINEVNRLVASESCGAISIFIGTTRNNFQGKEVIQLDYECYEEMAVKEIQKICKKLRDEYPNLVNIAVHHRIGFV